MEVLEDKDNVMFNRKEVKVVVKAEKNPSYEEATQMLVDQFKADKELIEHMDHCSGCEKCT